MWEQREAGRVEMLDTNMSSVGNWHHLELLNSAKCNMMNYACRYEQCNRDIGSQLESNAKDGRRAYLQRT